jgi:hypothetical protein
MEDVKRRLVLVKRFASGELPLGSEQFAYECVSVQLRKVLELVAFASLCANKAKYAEAYADFAKHWRAKALLQALGRLHPDFYPKPMKSPFNKPDGTKHLDRVADGFLTPDEFVVLYDKCSDVIHTRNPFSTSEPRIDFVHSVDQWHDRIMALLRLHLMRLAGSPEVWLVSMHEPSDGRVHAYIASPRAG